MNATLYFTHFLFALARTIQPHSQDLETPFPLAILSTLHSAFLHLPHTRPQSLGARGGYTVKRMKG